MPTPRLDDKTLIEALNLVEEYGSGHLALKAKATKTAARTTDARVEQARLRGLRPTFRKDAPRIYTRHRLGKTHCVIPDVQAKPGARNDHMEWIGNYIVEKQPDTIICIGDFWDFPSLCSYDKAKGRRQFEGRRYVHDVKAGRTSMEKLLKPIDDYNRTAKKADKYNPSKHFTRGNHEYRVERLVDENPEYEGKFAAADLGLEDYGWKVHDFLKVVSLDGIEYSHYFTSGVMGRPVGSAAALLRERQGSATMGHVQFTDHAIHKQTQKRAMFCGTCYLHDEDYLGAQGNSQRRQIVFKHEVEDGRYDLMEVSLRFLEKAYS
jgi:hypothetical protein